MNDFAHDDIPSAARTFPRLTQQRGRLLECLFRQRGVRPFDRQAINYGPKL
jgi:hypothetical protein